LRLQYLSLRDRLFRSRARAAAVGDALYSTHVQIHLNYKTPRYYSVTRALIRLDGANVFEDLGDSVATDQAPRFHGFLAPGRHRLSVRIEAIAKEDPAFSTSTETTLSFQAPAGRSLHIVVDARDDGTIPYQWKRKNQGSYKLRTDVAILTAKPKPFKTSESQANSARERASQP